MAARLFCALLAAALVSVRALFPPRELRHAPELPDSLVIHTYQQRVDHFSGSQDTWTQRYAVESSWYQPGGPVFFFLAGEAPMEVYFSEWAQQFGALFVMLEHRFYGKSVPTADFSNLTLLTSQQALADAAGFLRSFNETVDRPGPWIVFGCSYSGALSAWFREKYSDLVIASYAPSSPVQAVTDFSGFYEQFAKSASPECVTATTRASREITRLAATEAGRAKLSQDFTSCEPLTAERVPFFLYCIVGLLGELDQADNPPSFPLESTCTQLTNGSDTVANWGAIYLQQGGGGISGCEQFNGACSSFSEEAFVAALSQTSIEQQTGNRAWFWQSCNEFGYFATSDGTSVFPSVPLDLQLKWCSTVFGIPSLSPHVDKTNKEYGGQEHYKGTRVMTTNGLLDPWHQLSIFQSRPGVTAATYAAGHCAPLHAETSADPPSLVEARAAVVKFLEGVLASHRQRTARHA